MGAYSSKDANDYDGSDLGPIPARNINIDNAPDSNNNITPLRVHR